MKTILILLAVLSLQSCAALDLAKAVLPSNDSGISVDAQVGKEANKQVILGDQIKHEGNGSIQTMDTAFTGDLDTGSFVINNMPTKDVLWYASMCIFFLGVLFPSPFEITRWITTQVKKIRNS